MSEEKKQHSQGRRYAVLSTETIRMFAEAGGHADIPDDIIALLSEDVTYRIREATQNSCQFMRHARRKRMVSEDFNKALRVSDVQPVYGHGLTEPNPFRQTKEGDLYYVDDLDITLPSIASNNHLPSQLGETTVKAQWLAVEGVLTGTPLGTGMQAKVSGKVPKPVSDDLLTYYDDVTKAILGTDEEIMKLALVDLRTNSKIGPLLPYFVNFVSNGVKTVSHDISQLLCLLHTVCSLIGNTLLYLEPKPYLSLLVQTIMYCLIEPLAASINPLNDHWVLRDYAAHLLAQITRDWDSPVNSLRETNLMALQEMLYDQARPFCSHYGAIMGLVAFGTQAVEDVLLPRLASYWPHLMQAMNDTAYANAQMKADAHKVHGALLLAAECYLLVRSTKLLNLQDHSSQDEEKSVVQNGSSNGSAASVASSAQDEPTTSTPVKPGMQFSDGDLIGTVLELPESNNPHKQLLDNYNRLVEYFGDALSMKLPHYHVRDYYSQKQRETVVTLRDENSSKTGEELLQQFLQVDNPANSQAVVADDAADSQVVQKHADVNEEVEVDDDCKSESHSLDPMMDFDGGYDGDEKSVKSERSSRSSRSERSHSDETFNSFTDADADLTVKAVSESTGIKLFITKRSKVKPVESPPLPVEDPKLGKMPTLVVTQPKRVTKRYNISEVFEQVPLHQPPPVVFVFRFQRREHMFYRDLKRVKQVKPVYHPVQSLMLWRTHGKIPRPNLAKKLLQMHHYSGTLGAML